MTHLLRRYFPMIHYRNLKLRELLEANNRMSLNKKNSGDNKIASSLKIIRWQKISERLYEVIFW
jgi:hypothetical protein